MPDPKSRRIDLVDTLRALATLGGIALVGYGAWLHYPPLGFAAAGIMLAAVGVAAALRAR
jgi:hypothetical protein